MDWNNGMKKKKREKKEMKNYIPSMKNWLYENRSVYEVAI